MFLGCEHITPLAPIQHFVNRLLTLHFQGKNGQFKANIRPFIDACLHDTKYLTWSDPIEKHAPLPFF